MRLARPMAQRDVGHLLTGMDEFGNSNESLTDIGCDMEMATPCYLASSKAAAALSGAMGRITLGWT